MKEIAIGIQTAWMVYFVVMEIVRQNLAMILVQIAAIGHDDLLCGIDNCPSELGFASSADCCFNVTEEK